VDDAHYRVHQPHTAQKSKLTGYHAEGRWLQIRDDAHEKKDGCSGQTHLTALGKGIEARRLASLVTIGSSRCNKIPPMLRKLHRVQYAFQLRCAHTYEGGAHETM
jgi:hypothetical protein